MKASPVYCPYNDSGKHQYGIRQLLAKSYGNFLEIRHHNMVIIAKSPVAILCPTCGLASTLELNGTATTISDML